MQLDKAVKKLEKKYKVEKVPYEISYEEHYEFKVYGKRGGEVKLTFNGGFSASNKNEIFRIVVYDKTYLSNKGIGPGITLQELGSKASLGKPDFNLSDGLFIPANDFDGGYWMELSEKQSQELTRKPLTLKNLPSNIRVKALVFF